MDYDFELHRPQNKPHIRFRHASIVLDAPDLLLLDGLLAKKVKCGLVLDTRESLEILLLDREPDGSGAGIVLHRETYRGQVRKLLDESG